jgi:hypothetical protein
MEKVTLIRQEKKVLEEGVANLNEKILEARKRGEEQWERHKRLLLR